MKIGDKVRVVDCQRSYHEDGAIGRIVGETADSWLVDFGGGSLMDYQPNELEAMPADTIIGGTYHGMTPDEVLAQRDSFRRIVGE